MQDLDQKATEGLQGTQWYLPVDLAALRPVSGPQTVLSLKLSAAGSLFHRA